MSSMALASASSSVSEVADDWGRGSGVQPGGGSLLAAGDVDGDGARGGRQDGVGCRPGQVACPVVWQAGDQIVGGCVNSRVPHEVHGAVSVRAAAVVCPDPCQHQSDDGHNAAKDGDASGCADAAAGRC